MICDIGTAPYTAIWELLLNVMKHTPTSTSPSSHIMYGGVVQPLSSGGFLGVGGWRLNS